MRTLGITVLTVGLAAVVAAPAHAQRFRGRGMGVGGGFMLLDNKSVQQEIKLDPALVPKITKLVQETNARAREKMIDIPDELRREKIPQILRANNDELKAAVKDLLTPGQVQRLEQIGRQQQGIQAFDDPAVREKLRLTREQRSKLRQISEDTTSRTREIFLGANGDFQGAQVKIRALSRESLEKSMAILNDDQKAIWKEMIGEPFEMKDEPRPFRSS